MTESRAAPDLPARDGPLAGIFVVDLSRVLAGPFCTQILTDLGAQVLKIERPGGGDDSRAYGPFVDGESAYFACVNRGKGSIALELDVPEDKTILLQLLERADVLVENFRPGTLEKFGLGCEQLKEKFPRLIYASVSGFGQTGPRRRDPAYDMVVQAMGGIVSLTGHPGQPPARVGSSVGDLMAGMYTSMAIIAALYDRQKTGMGRQIDISMLDVQVAFVEHAIVRYEVTGEVPGPLGSRHATIAPFQAFATADGHIVVSCGNDSLFHTFAAALGKPEWKTDERYKTNSLRCKNIDQLEADIEAILTERPMDHWLDLLQKKGVPCSPINTVDKLVDDPQVLARNMMVDVDQPRIGKLKMAGNPIKMSGFEDPTSRAPAPDLDASRAAVMRWIAAKG